MSVTAVIMTLVKHYTKINTPLTKTEEKVSLRKEKELKELRISLNKTK